MRKFDSGATRDADDGKLDYEGFLSPLVMKRYAEYMHENRVQADGNVRDSDNWQKGIPKDAYMKSGFRHFMDWWAQHRDNDDPEYLHESLCALIFNAMGYLHEELKAPEQECAGLGTFTKEQHDATPVPTYVSEAPVTSEDVCPNCAHARWIQAANPDVVLCAKCNFRRRVT